jgi:two-component system OmpR family sensor kinase
MATLRSQIRSVAQFTFVAYRRVPVRWRLGGGSAALTFVILAGFAVVTDVLTDRQISNSFYARGTTAISRLSTEIAPTYDASVHAVVCKGDMYAFAKPDDAQIRLFSHNGALLCSQILNPKTQEPMNETPYFQAPFRTNPSAYFERGYRVNVARIQLNKKPRSSGWLIYALPLSSLDQTISNVRIFLAGGVIAGTVLALLAGLLVAQRAMRPIAELADVAREIERTRDPTLRIPHPEAEDEVAELARTLTSMLGALNAARGESEAALVRQREFVADASHELRTPLTSVLANLELLADELDGEQADSAKAALRSTRRMRRLVADLLLLARADVGRLQPRRITDLGDRLTDAASELGPVSEDHELTIDAGSAPLAGLTDDLHRLILNLLENAISHTPPGTHICARTGIVDGRPTLVVEDDGPGIRPEVQRRVFERFVRGGGDAGDGPRGTGLGLAIVDAVATSHGGTVTLTSLPEYRGARFEVVFPPVPAAGETESGTDGGLPAEPAGEPVAQTSTTTGRTIGRRRSRS